MPNNHVNADALQRRCAALSRAGYAGRWVILQSIAIGQQSNG